MRSPVTNALMMKKPVTCPECHADLDGDVLWCPRCFRRVAAVEGLGNLVAQLKRSREPAAAAPESLNYKRVMSRWHSGATTMGPRGKIAVTVAVALVWASCLTMMASSVMGRTALLVFIAATAPGVWVLLASTWRRQRALVQTAERTCRACRFELGPDAESCPRCMVRVA